MKEDKLKGNSFAMEKEAQKQQPLLFYSYQRKNHVAKKTTLPDPTMYGLCTKSRVQNYPTTPGHHRSCCMTSHLFCSVPVLSTLGIDGEADLEKILAIKGFFHALDNYGLSNLG